jgi:iron complex outermembrane receptor protein
MVRSGRGKAFARALGAVESKSGLLACAAVGALVLAIPAAAAETAADAGSTVAELVVTAQKRQERLQDVPIAINVVSPDQLKAGDMNETADLQYLVPGVQVNQINAPRAFGVFIRGIGTTSFSTQSIEPSAAYVIDGVVYGQAGASVQDTPDVDRIVVLKGPQGTLFGKNASAGVINIVTRRPSDAFEADARVQLAEPYDERKAELVVTGPLTSNQKFLVSGRLNQHDGYVHNVFDGRELNNRNDYGVRAKLEWTPTDRLDVTATADWFQRWADCCIFTLRRVGPTPSAIEQQAIAAGIKIGPDNLDQNINGGVISHEDNYGAVLQADYKLGGDYTLTSITAYRRWWTNDGLDTDSSPQNILDTNYANYWQNQTSQELRLTSPVGGRFDYVAGLYYFDQGVTYTGRQTFKTIPVPGLSFVNFIDAGTVNYAVFGQGNLHLTDKLTFIGGGRVLEDHYRAFRYKVDPVFGGINTARARKSDSGFVWRLGAQYAFDRDRMAFATVTRGYKGGGYDTNPNVPGLPSVGPEHPTNIELGVRTYWPDQRFLFNATAFRTVVTDYQANVIAFDPVTGVASNHITNVAKLQTKGVEFTGVWKPLTEQDLTLSLNGAYMRAIYKDFKNSPCVGGQTAAQGCIGGVWDLSGLTLARSPKWKLVFDARYAHPLGDTGLQVEFDGMVDFQTKMYVAAHLPEFLQPDRTLINASVAIGPQDRRWQLSLFARNLTDKNYFITLTQTSFGVAPASLSQYPLYEAHRIVGVALAYKFR